MKVLLTGGSGNLGQTLVPMLFDKDDTPVILDVRPPRDLRKEAVFIEGSILDRPKLTEIFHGCDCIVHIAAWHGIHETRGLGHDVITSPAAPEIVTVKGERKFITACANPADLAPTGSSALRRLRDRVIALTAERGFYVTARNFTPEAQHYAETAPIELIDGEQLVRALHRSRKGMFLPQTYKAMCRQCGDILQLRLTNDEAVRCGNGHYVAPTIARDDLVKPRLPQPPPATHGKAAPAHNPKIIKFRNMSAKAQRRRAITTRNLQARARAIKQQQRDG